MAFKLSSFLTRFKRGGSGAPASPPPRRGSAFPYEGATTGRRLGTWSTTRDAVNSVWYRFAEIVGASNPSGWSGCLKVKNPAGVTAGYILLYSNP